jgi:methylmalonyl-CoA mutase cobalamin-binding domain/chain
MKDQMISSFQNAILNYDHEASESMTRQALEEGIDPAVLANSLTDILGEVGEAFSREDIHLPELVLASRAGKSSMAIIEEALKEKSRKRDSIGRVLLGTVKGDVHDIGKNIVSTLFFAAGFEVKDLGVDVSAADFVAGVREYQPDILGLSALLTTTMAEQRHVIEELKKSDLRDEVRVIVGGAPVSAAFAAEIEADGYGDNAFEAIELGKALVKTVELESAE